MKIQILLPSIMLCGMAMVSQGQTYCVPPPYSSGPYTGIEYFSLDDWSNPTAYNGGYVYYEDETPPDLVLSSNFTLKMKCEHTIAGSGFSGNLNYRVWIDWNQDGDFEDEEEEVMTVNKKYYTDTQSVIATVPDDALTGETRMRVYNDMPADEGHDEPNPCGYLYSTNPVGHHGEVEDYIVNVVATSPEDSTIDEEWPTGLKEPGAEEINVSVAVIDGYLSATISSGQSGNGEVILWNATGQVVAQKSLGLHTQQERTLRFGDLPRGLYVLVVEQDNTRYAEKVMIR